MLPSSLDSVVYRALGFRDRVVDRLVVVCNVVLWPFAVLFDVIHWVFDLVCDLYSDYCELRDDFVPEGILVDFFIGDGVGVLLFWIFGPGNLTVPLYVMELPVAPLVAIFAGLFGLFTVPVAIWTLCEHLFSENGTDVNDSRNFWAVGFALFVIYTGFSFGYYLPWLLGMNHL